MYKHRIYANEGEVVFIDGKFSAARIKMYKRNGMWNCNTLYYMHEGVMLSTDDIFHDLSADELKKFLTGKAHEIVEYYGVHFEPCSTFLKDFRKMRTRQKICTAIAVGTEHAELVDYPQYVDITVRNTRPGIVNPEYLSYNVGGFEYSTEEQDIRFEGFPDMQDTSVHMNIMMVSGSVSVFQELVDLFKLYTARMDIQY